MEKGRKDALPEGAREIPGLPKYYATADGQIYSAKSRQFLKQRLHEKYFDVHISHAGKRSRLSVHRLILCAFKGECPPGLECNHLNDIGVDNHIDNLVWDTHKRNMQNRRWTPTWRPAKAKLFPDQVREIRQSQQPIEILAKKYQVSPLSIWRVVRRITWKAVA